MSSMIAAPPLVRTRPCAPAPRRVALWVGLLCLGIAGCEPEGSKLPRDDADGDMITGDIGDMGDFGELDRAVPDVGIPGTDGQPCRPDAPQCDGTLRCNEMRCGPRDPGEEGAPCRAAAPRCNAALLCEGDICVPNPLCPDRCDIGDTRCAEPDQGDGYLVCGGRLEDDCTVFGAEPDDPVIVACDEGRTCDGGTCVAVDSPHPQPEFALLIDRGISPAAWPEWRAAIVGWVRAVQPAIAVGAQTFPGEGPCLGGPQARSSRNDASDIAELLDLPAPADLGRPLFAIIGRSVQLLGRASEGQYAVLITTGDETCADPQQFVRRVGYLRGRGIRTRIIRVVDGDDAPDPVLDAAGIVGGLAVAEDGAGYRDVSSPSELRDVLDALARRADPACADLDEDGRGPFCAAGADCAPGDATAYEGAAEICDGVDNDCDGTTDEQVERDAPLADLVLGPCAGLTRSCVEGQWVEPDYAARVEGFEADVERSCDAVDNDCDGVADEALGDQAGACTVGLGACEVPGIYVCDPAQPARSICNARPLPPSAELCDAIDNDCDGIVDEDAPEGGIELCNGRDDDCDDEIDEDPQLERCERAEGQTALACYDGGCAVACPAELRDGGGDLDCESAGYISLGLGDGFTCLLDPQSGQPECYGRADAPVPPAGEIRQVVAGGRHACVLYGGARDGEISCSGPDAILAAATAGRYGEIGIGDRIGCGLTPAGAVECWSPDAASAGLFGADRVATHIAVGGRHVCAVDADGLARCYGTCGQGCLSQGAAPQRPRFAQLSAGAFHTCGVDKPLGYVYCWGAGRMPCVGDLCAEQQGQSMAPDTPGFRAVAAGALHTCAIAEDFSIRCWGLAAGGRTRPPAGRFSEIWAGGGHTCARRFDGRIRCWGIDVGGETGDLN